MSRPADKLKLWTGQPVNAPFMTPPIGLRFVLLLAVLSVTGTLVYGVFTQLGYTDFDMLSGFHQGLRVAVFFLLPMIVAVAIATNHPASRWVIAVQSLLLIHQATQIAARHAPDSQALTIIHFVLLTTLALIWWWLFRSRRMRFYYSMISGRGVPKDLQESAEELSSPGSFDRRFSKVGRFVAPVLEFLALLLVFVSLYFMLDTIGWMT